MPDVINAHPPCDVCGKPATQLARDVFQRIADDGYHVENSPGHWKFGCDEHPVQTHTYEQGPLEYAARLLRRSRNDA